MNYNSFSEEDIRPKELFNTYLKLAKEDILNFFTDKENFIEINCPACSSDEKKLSFIKQGFEYQSCLNCFSLYLSPRPNEYMINLFYKHGASVKYWSTHFFKYTSEIRRNKLIKPKANSIIENAKKYLNTNKNLTFCDIGSGYGLLLEEISKMNLFRDIFGIEPSPNLANDCRSKGFQIIEKSLEKIEEQEISVDYATSFEVLEHLFDPHLFLTSAKKIIKKNGIMQFTTLSCTGFDMQTLWENSDSIYPPHHINLLSNIGLKILIERAKLKVLDFCTPGKLDLDIVRNAYTKNPSLVSNRFIKMLCESEPDIRSNFQNFLQENHLSSHVNFVITHL
ncbi:class I SAM-dependent methyltransferase [Fluviispira sanaruensis]|uniref:Class I SAM-dependent methyltransferase n=1 Tax=Fluviispira sanaruensis TaxID=2493639 RepID=A0A4P2VYJ8_FLUSA|nr:class I SAM-dependent methyltransferase [Fluviispira sanaruensis]BBH54072.1 class I SAM-dependent methyltransferase [Fluviispira sanaruensis]